MSGVLTYELSFLQHSGNNDATIDDLVDGGIPRLSARDICRAMSEVIQRRNTPLFILWDIENIPIPTSASAAHVASQIKDAVAPYGRREHFHAYASASTGQISEEKRSELQLSGCILVDSPHLGRKEVADKMIIVDAMEFAYTHPDGATLCLITGDVDYAYLLSKLQKPQWATIVISKGDRESMLHANCGVRLRWETDILGVISESGDGDLKTSHLNQAFTNLDDMSSIKVSEMAPLSVNEMTDRALQVAKEGRKYIIFVKKFHAPRGDRLSGTFVQKVESYLLLMFNSLKEAQSFAAERPWLCQHGILVNWLTCSKPKHDQHSVIIQNEVNRCALCNRCNCITAKDDIFFLASPGDTGGVCCICFESCGGWSEIEKRKAQEKVVSALKMMEEYDDFFVERYVIRRTLLERYPSLCASKSQANLWIDSSIQAGLIVETRHWKTKREKVLGLPKYKRLADLPYPQIDTSEAEWFIVSLLRNNGGTMERTQVNQALRENDPQRMSIPFMRSLVMQNAESNNLFFIDRSARIQMVSLTIHWLAKLKAANLELALTSVEFDEANATVHSSSTHSTCYGSWA